MSRPAVETRKIRVLVVLLASLLLAGITAASGAPDAAARPEDETAVTVVYSGVTDYALAPPAVFWHENMPCNGSPDFTEAIAVLPLAGGLPRSVYAKEQACGTSAVLSNVAVDESYLYWISPYGLVRLPRSAAESNQP